eukprot:2839049-Rhodomonas_salina.1
MSPPAVSLPNRCSIASSVLGPVPQARSHCSTELYSTDSSATISAFASTTLSSVQSSFRVSLPSHAQQGQAVWR